MFGQPSRDDVLKPGSVPGVASIETADTHGPYAWASAREKLVPSTAGGPATVESQDTPARLAARAPQSDRIEFFVNILHLHERGMQWCLPRHTLKAAAHLAAHLGAHLGLSFRSSAIFPSYQDRRFTPRPGFIPGLTILRHAAVQAPEPRAVVGPRPFRSGNPGSRRAAASVGAADGACGCR